MSHRCGCNDPQTAEYYWEAIISRDVPGGTETSHVDGYVCASHCPTEDEIAARSDGTPDPWFCLEANVTPIKRSNHFHAGWHIPGYLPQTLYERFDSMRGAMDYLADEISRDEGSRDALTEWAYDGGKEYRQLRQARITLYGPLPIGNTITVYVGQCAYEAYECDETECETPEHPDPWRACNCPAGHGGFAHRPCRASEDPS